MVTQAIVVDSGTSFHLPGRDLLADVRAPGRFGWINLPSLAAAGRGLPAATPIAQDATPRTTANR